MELIFSLKNKEQILLRADKDNFELCRIRNRKDEKTGEVADEWTAFKWFPSLYQALNRIIDLKIRASDATSIKQLAVDLEEARKEITKAWSTAVPSP